MTDIAKIKQLMQPGAVVPVDIETTVMLCNAPREEIEAPPKTCAWSQEDTDSGVWETECDNLFELFDGGPSDNGFNFCPYCGGHLVEPE